MDENVLHELALANPEWKNLQEWAQISPHKYHYWRWWMLAILIVGVCVITIASLAVFRSDTATQKSQDRVIADLQSTNKSLQQTNCKLKIFLLTARAARIDAALEDKDPRARANDIQAAIGYDNLINPFADPKATGHCPIPEHLLEPIPKH